MSETKNPGEKKLSVSGKTLTLKPRTETGVVRQSFSHGRSKQVVVEKVKRRMCRRTRRSQGGGSASPLSKRRKPLRAETSRLPATRCFGAHRAAALKPKPSGVVLRTLTEEERQRARTCARRLARPRGGRTQDRRGRGPPPRQPRSRSTAASAKPPTRASARKTSAASTTKKPNARPVKSPRSASARDETPAQPRPGSPPRRSKPTKTKHRAAPSRAGACRAARSAPPRPAPAPRSNAAV